MRRILQRNIYDNVFWLLLSLWLFVDTINGFFLNNNASIPFSQVFKAFVFCLVLVKICHLRSGRIGVVFFLFYLIVFSLHLSFNGNNAIFLNETFSHFFKFLLVIVVYYYVKKQILLYPLLIYGKIFRVFKINLIVFVFNIFLGLAGLGFTSYGDFGYKGFFYAGNELSGVVIVLFPFFVNYIYVKYSYKSIYFLLVVLLLFLTVGLMGTKSSLIAFLFSIVYIFMLSDKKANNKITKNVLLCVLLSFIIWGGYYLVSELGMLDRWLFFYDKGGLDMLILSGRGDYWMEEKTELFNSSYATLLLGLGGAKTVEMDPLDALLNYGLVGVMLVYSFYLYLLVVSYRRRYISRTVKLVFFVNLLILFSSSISGHLLFSGMVNIFIALLNALVYLPKEFSKETNI